MEKIYKIVLPIGAPYESAAKVDVIKLFIFVTDASGQKARVFDLGKHFQPSTIIASIIEPTLVKHLEVNPLLK